MTHVRSIPMPSSFRRLLAPALLVSLLPAAAFAQSGPRVRVTGNDTEIRAFQLAKDDVIMTADAGTELQVIHVDGDKYRHVSTNWYWVLLPRDEWGTQRAGWISGRAVELLPPAEPVKAAAPVNEPVIVVRNPPPPPAREVAPPPPPPPAPVVEKPAPFEVIVNFEFDKSNLTDEAKAVLAAAADRLKGAQDVAVALEGHADATGPEQYNEKLGLARAETVKRYLAEQFEIAVEKITVVSYGEERPADGAVERA